jgi:hypothetical protein
MRSEYAGHKVIECLETESIIVVRDYTWAHEDVVAFALDECGLFLPADGERPRVGNKVIYLGGRQQRELSDSRRVQSWALAGLIYSSLTERYWSAMVSVT